MPWRPGGRCRCVRHTHSMTAGLAGGQLLPEHHRCVPTCVHTAGEPLLSSTAVVGRWGMLLLVLPQHHLIMRMACCHWWASHAGGAQLCCLLDLCRSAPCHLLLLHCFACNKLTMLRASKSHPHSRPRSVLRKLFAGGSQSRFVTSCDSPLLSQTTLFRWLLPLPLCRCFELSLLLLLLHCRALGGLYLRRA
jgi:hypothetical protein